MKKSKPTSELLDDNPQTRINQAANSDFGIPERIQAHSAFRGWADLGRKSGIPSSSIHEISKGRIPRADRAVAVAKALGETVEWMLGEESVPAVKSTDGWLMTPSYSLFGWTDGGKPAPSEIVPIPKDFLTRTLRVADQLWLAEMPSDAMPEIAREGDAIICQDVTGDLIDGRVYIFMLDWRPLVRRVSIRPEGVVLKANDPAIDPLTISRGSRPDIGNDLIPVARVLGAFMVQAA